VLVMSSVFISAAFLPGTTGQLYKQFAITIAISVIISGFVALTLTPAMCGVMLKHTTPPQKGFFAAFNRGFARFTDAFGRAVTLVIKRMAIAFILLAVMVYLIIHLFKVLPTSFVPNEDQGYVMATAVLPDAASLNRTQEVDDKIDKIFAGMPAVENRVEFSGYSLLDSGFKTNTGTFFVTLKPFEERYKSTKTAKEQNAGKVLRDLHSEASRSSRGLSFPSPPGDPRDRDNRGLRVLDPGHGLRRSGKTRRDNQAVHGQGQAKAGSEFPEHDVPGDHATVARRCEQGEGHPARRPGAGCLQCDPGPVRVA